MMFDRLCAASVDSIAIERRHESIQIVAGLRRRIGMNDPDAHAHSVSTPRKYPAVARRSSFITHHQYGLALIAVRSKHVVLCADSEPAKSRCDSRLLHQR